MSTNVKKINVRSPYYLTTGDAVPIPPVVTPPTPVTQVNCGDTWLTGVDVGDRIYEFNTSEVGDIDIVIGGNDVPVSFTLEWDGNTATTGFIGLDTYDQELLDAGVSAGDINTGNPSTKNITLTINKTSATPTLVKLNVLATLVNDNYSLAFNCPAPSTPAISCGVQSNYSGGQSYPQTDIITLGSNTGTVTLSFGAISIPDKFIVEFDGVEVINTGYRGASYNQIPLDNSLIALGEPTELIVGPGSGTATFQKTTATTTATVKVYAPMSGTGWSYILSCPQ